jgi:hypothetical protein
LREAGQTVVFVDADPRRCRVAEEDGFQVVFGDGLQDRTLRRIPIELVGTAIGATFNDNLNSQFARLTRQTFGVLKTYVSVDALDGGRPPEHVSRNDAQVLFGRDHDQERWDVRWRQGDVEVVTVAWQGLAADHSPPDIENRPGKAERDSAVLMVLTRNGRTSPYSMAVEPRTGDTAVAALDSSRRDTALASLRASGWEPAESPKTAGSEGRVPTADGSDGSRRQS